MSAEMYEKPENVFLRQVGDELVLLQVSSELYHGLDDIGRRCYEHVTTGGTVSEVALSVAEEFGEEAARVQADMQTLIDELLEAGLLQLNEG